MTHRLAPQTALRQREPTFVSKKLRDSARGQECTLQISDVCNGDPSTTVLAHMQFDGGMMGGKTDDWSACFACSSCHEALDQRKIPYDERWLYMGRAMRRTWDIWIRDGLIKI